MNNSYCNLNWFTTVNSASKSSDPLAEDSLAPWMLMIHFIIENSFDICWNNYSNVDILILPVLHLLGVFPVDPDIDTLGEKQSKNNF